jgi:uncharacterized protein YkwD
MSMQPLGSPGQARSSHASLRRIIALSAALLLSVSSLAARPTLSSAPSITFSGEVTDAQSGHAIADAAVNARAPGDTVGSTVRSDRSGHYSVRIPFSRQVQLAAVAIGYQWRVQNLTLAGDAPTASAQAHVDFTGAAGLRGDFLPLQETDAADTLVPFSQVIAAHQTPLSFSGTHLTPLEESYAVTYPNGDAAEFPLRITHSSFSSQLAFDHGPGVYQLEINDAGGTAVFNLPIYYGVAPSLPPLAASVTSDNTGQTEAVARAEALSYLNALRSGRPALRESAAIDAAAIAHSSDILQHPGQWRSPHVGSDGSDDYVRLTRAGVPMVAVGEAMVLRVGPGSAAGWSLRGAIDGLMASPAHRLNLLFRDFDRVGIGLARDSTGRVVLTIDLAASATVFALYGAIHMGNGAPVVHAPLTFMHRSATTDAAGRFMLRFPITTNLLGPAALEVTAHDGSASFTVPLRGEAAPTTTDGPVPYGPLQLTIDGG